MIFGVMPKKKTSKKTIKKTASSEAQTQLEGKKAPDFNLKDFEASSHPLASFKSPYLVLFFYPKDNTPGCTVESISFSKDLEKFKKLGADVIGISGGDEKTKTKFIQKHKLKVKLLSDPEFKTSKKYRSYGKKSFMGRTYDGIYRNTFVLDKNRKIIKVFESVKPPIHSKEVLEYLKSL